MRNRNNQCDGGPGGSGLALAASQAVSGNGGNSQFGEEVVGLETQSAGANAGTYGAGGSGGCAVSGGTSVAGVNGIAGVYQNLGICLRELRYAWIQSRRLATDCIASGSCCRCGYLH